MAHLHEVIDQDNHFIINDTTRKIEPAVHDKNKIMQYDHNSERYTFEIPKVIDGHDMSLCNIVQIHFINISANKTNSNADVYEVNDLAVSSTDESKLLFSWLVSKSATQLNGTLNFAIRFACTTEDVIDYDWHTDIYTGITISNSINNIPAIIEDYSDVLEEWRQKLFSGEIGGTTNYDQLQNKPIIRLTGTEDSSVILRNLETGQYILNGKFIPFDGSTNSITIAYPCFANVVNDTSETGIQIFLPKPNVIRYIAVTDTGYTSNTTMLDSLKEEMNIESLASPVSVIDILDNTFYRTTATLTTLTLKFPTDIPDDFYSKIRFNSGSTPTTITTSNPITWFGKDVIDGVFTPQPNSEYHIEFYKNFNSLEGYVRVDDVTETDPTVSDWAKKEVELFDKELFVDSGNENSFVTIDDVEYYRYRSDESNFRYYNPYPKVGSVKIAIRVKTEDPSSTGRSEIYAVFTDGTESRIHIAKANPSITTITLTGDKTLSYIRGSNDTNEWLLIDMSVMDITALYDIGNPLTSSSNIRRLNIDLAEANDTVPVRISTDGYLYTSAGAKGEPGTSITITSISESTEDGGNNIVTFSDGETLTVKNGSAGSPGESYTLTDQDKQDIATLISASIVDGNEVAY